jgi:HlyD family secretion protein
MAKTRLRSVTMGLLAVAVIGAGVWYFKIRSGGDAVSFRTVRLDRGAIEQSVTATGSVSAVVTVQVGSQVSGVISKLGADFNSQVKAGDIVAQIDPTRFRANLAQADATLKSSIAAEARAGVSVRQAKLDLDRAQTLVTKQVLGAADLDAARTKYDQAIADVAAAVAQTAQARAAVGVARVDVERTTIRAPIDGVVLQRSVDVGQTVAASLQAPVLFTIAQDLSRMEVHAAIDEADVGKLREGQQATFTVDAYPNDVFHATIFQLRKQPTVVQNVVTYDAVVRFENKDAKLRPGMTATVRVVANRKDDVLRVPNAALRFKPATELIASDGAPPGVTGGGAGVGGGAAAPTVPGDSASRGGRRARGRARVFKPAGQKVAAVAFKTGISDDEFTEVAESTGLAVGDEIVLDMTGGSARAAGSSPSGSSRAGGGNARPPRVF